MKDMKLTLIDKQYTVEMNSHEYIKYIACNLGIATEKEREVCLKEYYTNIVETFFNKLSRTKDPMMSVADIQEYAEALHTISMMFDLSTKEVLTPIPAGGFRNTPDGIIESGKFPLQGNYDENGKIDLTKKTVGCTYIPELDIYVKDYGTGIDLDYKRLWYTNEFDTLMEVSMDDYTIISETIETSKLPRAGTKGVEICH